MTETKWTPGPWAMPDVEIGIISKFISPGRWDGMIATADCGNFARSRSEGLANARLIAAAPDMYAALEMVSGMDLHHEVLAVVDAAMSKARGEIEKGWSTSRLRG